MVGNDSSPCNTEASNVVANQPAAAAAEANRVPKRRSSMTGLPNLFDWRVKFQKLYCATGRIPLGLQQSQNRTDVNLINTK